MLSYLDYVARSIGHDTDVVLTQMLRTAGEPFVDEAVLTPLALANTAFLDGLVSAEGGSLRGALRILSNNFRRSEVYHAGRPVNGS